MEKKTKKTHCDRGIKARRVRDALAVDNESVGGLGLGAAGVG